MSKFVIALKHEIGRLARKEVRKFVSPVKREVVRLKQVLRATEARAVKAEALLARLQAGASKGPAAPVGALRAVGDRTRMSPRLIKALRSRLGLTQKEMARLAGVTPVCIYYWESGRTAPRGHTRTALVSLRQLGRRDAKRRLDELAEAKTGRTKASRSRRQAASGRRARPAARRAAARRAKRGRGVRRTAARRR
jgi:DNA-binding transcriptional regulator YiaG